MISLRKIEYKDLEFVSEVRNECSFEFLHDSRTFTISETIEWFKNTNPYWFIIEIDNHKIGYFRTSNYEPEENSIHIGCDIHKEFRGKGYGYESYLAFIDFLYKEKNINTINLEVLSTNIVAKKLYQKLGFKNFEDKDTIIEKNGSLVKSEFWSLKKSKVCYIINFYFGERRNRVTPIYNEDRLCFLKKHIELLNKLKHNMDKVIFNFNVDPSDYSTVNNALKITPKKINKTNIEVKLRQNFGMSYGAWSDNFIDNKDEYDYFIFNEDDYFFIIDYFDQILVNKFESKENSGYLCGLVLETKIHPLHAAHATGISSNKVLSEVVKKFGELPHNKSNDYGLVQTNSQVRQTNSMVEMGYMLYDLGDEYRINFDGMGRVKSYYTENNKLILEPWINVYQP